MSAYIVSNKTIDAIVYGMTVPECVGRDSHGTMRYCMANQDGFELAERIGDMATELSDCRLICRTSL